MTIDVAQQTKLIGINNILDAELSSISKNWKRFVKYWTIAEFDLIILGLFVNEYQKQK